MQLVDRLVRAISSLARAIVTRSLDRRELAVTAVALFVGGTLYCAIYCRVAFYPMHEGGMPLWLSAWWAGTALLPWFAAFEGVKRIVPRLRDRRLAFTASAAIALGTAVATIFLHRVANVKIMDMSPDDMPSLIANQLQPAVLFAFLVAVWAMNRMRDPHNAAATNEDSETLPAFATIEWIRAAGNYVEIKSGDRVLIRRMTMRRAEATTRSADFIRIHRSIIVRRQLIAGFGGAGRSRLLLTTGEAMPVGDSYRRAVERLVPSSQAFGTSAHFAS